MQFCAGLQGQRRQTLGSVSGLINTIWVSFASFGDGQTLDQELHQEQPLFIIDVQGRKHTTLWTEV